MATATELVYRPLGAASIVFDAYEPEILLVGPARTGKSRAIGELLFKRLTDHPMVRVAMVRKTRASIAESFAQMWETRVLADGADETYLETPLAEGPNRVNRHSYKFKNGSELVLEGMDRPTRLYSTEWDIIYVQEAIELTLDEWERLNRGLTNKRIPHPLGPDPETGENRFLAQLIGDTNPDAPHHWLRLRCLSGKTREIKSRHEDNPSLTKQDLDRLRAMTGTRRQRLYEGLWVASEGAVWGNWDPTIHVIDEAPEYVDEQGKRWSKLRWRLASVDWGYTNPGTIQVWGVDADRRMYLEHEVYKSGETIDYWIEQAKRIKAEWNPVVFVADPSEPGYIKQFKRAGIPTKEADNDVRPGLDGVRDRLAVQKDGKPRFFVIKSALHEKDTMLVEKNKPTCLAEEIPSYVFREDVDGKPIKEEPDPSCADHGCDAARYAARYADVADHSQGPTRKTYAPGTWGYVLGMNEDLDNV